MSHFDALLDFNDTTGGTVQKSPDFDPFGPSSAVDMKGGSDGDLLVDFGFTGQSSVKTNGQGVNPLYELSMDQDFSASESNNLIMADDIQVSQKSAKSANPLYDLENDSSVEPSANPLYDLSDNTADTNGHDMDLMGTETLVTLTDDSNKGVNIIVNTGNDGEEFNFEVRKDESHGSMNGISDEDSELVERYDSELAERFTKAESEEILQNQNKSCESNTEQFEDHQVYVPEEEDQNLDVDHREYAEQNEPADEYDTQNEPAEEYGTQYEPAEEYDAQNEPVEEYDTQNEPAEEYDIQNDEQIDQFVEETQVEQEIIEETQQEPDVYCEEEPVVNVCYEEEPVEPVTEEASVDAEEQEVIPTEEFRSRSSSSSSDEQKETTTTTKTTTGGKTAEQTQVTKETKGSHLVENGLDDGAFRESYEREEISFDQMSSIRNKLESDKSDDTAKERKKSVHEEIADAEGGEYENEPVRNPDVVRESDRDIGAELPEVGTARSILEKFKQIETTPKTYKREKSPPAERRTGKVEYVSEPAPHIEVPPPKIEGGVFENQPLVEEGVVHSYDALEEALPEKGTAKNILEKFKQIQTEKQTGVSSPQKREITPDRNTKFEYVSEPRAVMEKYEGRVEAGIFESQPTEAPDIVKSGITTEEVLPEKGTAKSLVSRYKEYSEKASSPKVSERKRELTPDKTGKVEYVSEPRTTFEKYEGKSEAGVFESKPEFKEEIVRSDMALEDILPEKGAAKNIAARFREIGKANSPTPTSSPKPKFKEVTPPRDDVDGRTVAGVLESTPASRGDIVKSADVHDIVHEEELPERGMAKNIANKFKQIQQSSSSSPTSRGKKEFTPPPDKGVFENTPKPSLVVEVRQAESGILESTPTHRDDVAREQTYSAGDVEFPEEGYAKNMVSKWKQLESQSGQSTPSPKVREFTPPRDFPLSPKSPAGVDSSVQPSDLPGQYQEQSRPSIYENRPSHRYDVVREGESNVAEELPEKDAAKSMVEKFKALQEQAKKAEETPKPVSRKTKNVLNE